MIFKYEEVGLYTVKGLEKKMFKYFFK